MKHLLISIAALLITACGSIDRKMQYWETELSKNTPVGTLKSDVASYLDTKNWSTVVIERSFSAMRWIVTSMLLLPQKEPWGPSSSINSASEVAGGFRIEMQSGDVIEIEATHASLSKL